MKSRMNDALRHAKKRAKLLSRCSTAYIIHISAKELGVPRGRDGGEYVRIAVRMLCENPSRKLSNGVYLAVGMAAENPAGEDQVEQAIRAVIKSAWDERDDDVWGCYFPATDSWKVKCPSNKDFLMALVDYVGMWEVFCEEVNYGK